MQLVLKITSLILILSTTSCAFFNNKTVPVTINSYPTGAKIYVDDVYYGVTAKEIDVIPDKTHRLKLVKDGYRNVEMDMETKFSLRNGQPGYSKCKLDLLGSIFILPIVGLKSLYCRDFTQKLYYADLEALPAPVDNSAAEPIQNYTPFSARNYYLPPAITEQNQNSSPIPNVVPNNVDPNQKSAYEVQPLFNNQSEFVHNGNDVNSAGNVNQKSKVDYYNWQ